MKNKVAVIFDFDGTLVDSLPMVYKATCEVFTRCELPHPTFNEYLTELVPPWLKFYADRGVGINEIQIREIFSEVLKFEIPRLFPDASEALAYLNSLGIFIGVVSAQSYNGVLGKCQTLNISKFIQCIVGGQEYKSIPIMEMCRTYGLQNENTFFVGDLRSDVVDAKLAGVNDVGITRGNNTEIILRNCGAKYCIAHLTELFPIIGVPGPKSS